MQCQETQEIDRQHDTYNYLLLDFLKIGKINSMSWSMFCFITLCQTKIGISRVNKNENDMKEKKIHFQLAGGGEGVELLRV